MERNAPLSGYLKGSGKVARLAGLARIGIETVGDLLYHLPSRYTDGAKSFDGTLTAKETIRFSGIITSIRMRRSRGRRRTMLAEGSIAADGLNTKRVRCMWFNQPYIAKQFSKGDAVEISGTVSVGKQGPYLTNPMIKPAKNTVVTLSEAPLGGNTELMAIYPETRGISSLYLRSLIERLLKDEGIRNIPDPIPKAIRENLNLPSLYYALCFIHRPKAENEYLAARKYFIFEKVFALQLSQQMNKKERERTSAYTINIDMKEVDMFVRDRFEFNPTPGQQRAIKDIINDINEKTPMARLLEGDVGSGKTAVAAAVMYGTVVAEKEEKATGRPQSAYLAPTEILAQQQFQTLVALFGHLPIQIGLITSKSCLKFPSKTNPSEPTPIPKKKMKELVANGEIAIVVGTHALIQKDVSFKRLALVIVDEQHRFGVAQRQKLFDVTETHRPHFLSMTATPIPRTLALTIYGDLSISIIDTLPKERKPVKTKLLKKRDVQKAYDRIREEVSKGHQAYVICPLVEEKEDSHLRSVAEEHRYLSESIFPDLAVEKMHGKMKPKEKQEIMQRFGDGEIDVLVSTIVVEVGINIPNATLIAILHAERFGLAQLHQLRGRVLRSSHEPFCYAVTDSTGESTLERLQVFEKTHDGFALAEKDLAMRGSGELGGFKQSGIPDLVWEGLRNPKLVARAQESAASFLDENPTLENHPLLSELVEQQGALGD